MDFDLTGEQQLIQETVREFVDARVLPNAIENDINHHLDLGIIEGMAELGLLGIVIPEEYGGAGRSVLTPALLSEEVGGEEAADLGHFFPDVRVQLPAVPADATVGQEQRRHDPPT